MCLDILFGSSTTDLYLTCPQKFWLRKVHAVSRLLRDYLHIHISGGWENWHIMQMKAKWLNTFLIYTSSSSPPTLAHVLVMDWLPESWVSGFGNSCHSLLDNAPLRVRYPIEKDFCRFRIVVVAKILSYSTLSLDQYVQVLYANLQVILLKDIDFKKILSCFVSSII